MISTPIRLDWQDRDAGRVAWLTLANPARRNALGDEAIDALTALAADVSAAADLRAVVLAGEGPVFCAGADVRILAALTPATARGFITRLHEAIDAVRRLPAPVIARLSGHCLGGAVELAAACDIRIGDASVRIAMPEVRAGIPSVIEAALLPRLVGEGRAREMMLTGRTYDAGQAYRMGFLQTLTNPEDLDGAVEASLRDILAAAPGAVRAQKALLNRWQEPGLAEAVAHSIDAFAAAYETDEPARYLTP